MKIAVTYENGNVFQHFGHTEQFKLYQAEGRILPAARWWTPTARATARWLAFCRLRACRC